MKHRWDNHEMPACRDDVEDKCTQSAEIWYYKHKTNPYFRKQKPSVVICYSCQQEANILGSMMEHRKENYPELV